MADFGGEGEEQAAEMKIELPPAAVNLLAVANFKVLARVAGLTDVALQGNFIKFAPAELPEAKEMRPNRIYPGSLAKPALNAILIPKPKNARIGCRDLADAEVLKWAQGVLEAIFEVTPERLAAK